MGELRMQSATEAIRIPLYNEQQAPKYTFFGGYGEQMYVNCYPEISRNTATGDGEITIQRRQGFTKKMRLSTHFSGTDILPMANISVATLDDVNVAAFWDAAGTAIRIIQYRPDANTSTLIGSITTANTTGAQAPSANDELFITECELVNAGTIYPGIAVSWRKYNSTYSDGYWARSSSGVFSAASLTQITAASFPVTLGKIITGPFQQMNGVFYIMGTNGNIYNSGGAAGTINDLTQWDALGVIKAQQSIDAGVGVFRYKHHLIAFGRSSIEFFNDVGEAVPASPLGLTEQAFIKFGAYSAKHITSIEDVIYFVGIGNDSTNGIYKLDGYTPTRISSLPIDMTLTDTAYAQENMSLHSFLVNGRTQLLINDITLANEFQGNFPLDTTNNIDDTTTVDAADATEIDGTVHVWAYNLVDNTGWWGINNGVRSGSDQAELGIVLPAMHTTYNYPARKQYILQYDSSGFLDAGTVYQMSGQAAGGVTAGSYYDGNGASSETLYAFASWLRTNLYSMSSVNRKRITKAHIEWHVHPKDSATGSESVYLGIDRDSIHNTNNNIIWRRKVVPSTGTGVASPFRWHNLGQARQMQFTIFYKGRSNFSPKALELIVSQGTK